MFVDMIKVFIL